MADQGYCVRCKKNQDMVDSEVVKTKNGREMRKGNCIKCNCRMCRILSKTKQA